MGEEQMRTTGASTWRGKSELILTTPLLPPPLISSPSNELMSLHTQLQSTAPLLTLLLSFLDDIFYFGC